MANKNDNHFSNFNTLTDLKFRRSSARSMSESGVASSALLPSFSENFREVALLPAVEDDYGGIIVEVKSPIDPEDFASSLKASLSLWRHQVATNHFIISTT